MKTDLKDTTFVIPVRIDSIIRLENLLLTLDNLESNFDTNIVIVEAAYYNNRILQQLIGSDISYRFIEEKDPVFHRTRHLNIISNEVKTAFIGIWDADVILESSQILEAIQKLRGNLCDFAYPYNGKFLDTSEILRNHYLLNKDIGFLKKNMSKMNILYSLINEFALGGAFLISTEKYKLSGLENEDFYGWGVEDGVRYHKWLLLNYSMYRSEGPLFHLTHPRDINGKMRSESYNNKATDMIYNIINSTRKELEENLQNRTYNNI